MIVVPETREKEASKALNRKGKSFLLVNGAGPASFCCRRELGEAAEGATTTTTTTGMGKEEFYIWDGLRKGEKILDLAYSSISFVVVGVFFHGP